VSAPKGKRADDEATIGRVDDTGQPSRRFASLFEEPVGDARQGHGVTEEKVDLAEARAEAPEAVRLPSPSERPTSDLLGRLQSCGEIAEHSTLALAQYL
jgi:hypothetical protein